MEFIQQLENLKTYVASLARTDMVYTSMPPKHGFSNGATVESVIEEIDKIIYGFISLKEGHGNKSAAARRLRYVVEQGDFSYDQISLLLEIANMAENECEGDFVAAIDYDQSNKVFKYPQINSSNINLRMLVAFIKSYVDNGGPCTYHFIEDLYDYIDQLDEQIDYLEKNQSLFKIKSKILDRIHSHS